MFQASAWQVNAFQIGSQTSTPTPAVEEARSKGGWDPYAYRRRRKDKSVKEFYEDILDRFIEEPTAKAEAAIEAFAEAAQNYEEALTDPDITVTLTNSLFDKYQAQFNRVVRYIAPERRAEFAEIVSYEEEELEVILMLLDLD